MDNIQACARAFEHLKQYKYELVLARKGVAVTLLLGFQTEDFFHLAGLHKLTDLAQIRDRKHAYVYRDIMSGKITDRSLASSSQFRVVERRAKALSELEQMLDGDDLYFAYDVNKHPYSSIQAKYLVSGSAGNETAFLFLDESAAGTYYARSFFPMDRQDFRVGLRKYTLIEKTKINLVTGARVQQYKRLPKSKI